MNRALNTNTARRKDYGRCEATGKLRFAFLDARDIGEQKRRRNSTNHAHYRCLSCGYWHVGSTFGQRRRPGALTSPRSARPRGTKGPRLNPRPTTAELVD